MNRCRNCGRPIHRTHWTPNGWMHWLREGDDTLYAAWCNVVDPDGLRRNPRWDRDARGLHGTVAQP